MTTAATPETVQRPLRALRSRLRRADLPVMVLLLVLFVGALSIAPLLRLAQTALFPEGGFDLARMADLLATPRVRTATLNTLWISLAATLLATALGTAAALLVALTDMRARTAWIFGFVLPLMIPPQVMALAWIQSLSPASPLLAPLGLTLAPGTRHPLFSAWGIVLLLGLYNAPLVFLTVRATLRRLPADLIEAARAGGARPRRVLATIILPLARGGICAGAALAFVSAIGNFGIQAMLGIPARVPTLITLIYRQMNSYGTAALADLALLALLLAGITVLGMALAGWLGRRSDQRVDGAARPIRFALGSARPLVETLAWVFLALTLLLPVSALVGSSLVSGYGQALTAETFTLAHYHNALFAHEGIRAAFATSLGLTLAAVAILAPVSVALGYVLVWRPGPVTRLLHLASELAYALPGIIIGIAMILFFLRPIGGISLYGTVWIILAAYLSNFLALALRPVLGGFAQLNRNLDEAAQVAGAGLFARLRDIVLPMLAPSVAAGSILVFMSALNEIQVSILLVTSRAQTIGPMIIFLEEAGSSTLAAAVGCLMLALVLALMLASLALGRRLPEGVLPWRD